MKKFIYIIILVLVVYLPLDAQLKKAYSILNMPQSIFDWYKYDYESIVFRDFASNTAFDNNKNKKSQGVLCLLDFLNNEGNYKQKNVKEVKAVSKAKIETVPVRAVELSINPNPISDEINVELFLPETSNVKLELYNMLGKKTLELSDRRTLSAGNHKLTFNRGAIPTGAYYLKLYSDNEQAVKMVVFE